MKYKHIIPFIALAGMSLMSCDDDKMNWYKDPSHGEVTEAEIPLALAEKISRYDALKSYASFTLGVGVGADLYLNNEEYRALVEENFDEITIGYAMKHGPMVNSSGQLNFTTVDKLIERLQSVGLGLYGHTLVWHQNQNASYLNGLIAATVIPGADGDNLLTNGDFENGSEGWDSWGGAKESVEATSEVKLAGEKSLKIVTKSSAANLWDLQIESPSVPTVTGHRYEISFWVKSEQSGGVRLSFADTNQMSGSQYPWHSEEGEYAITSSEWKQVVYSGSTIYSATNDKFTAKGSSMKFRLDFGKFPDVTYYIDNVTVVDLDAEPSIYIDNVVVEQVATTKSKATKSATIVEKTDEEKAEIIGDALESWISQMVSHCKGIVKAWDVVNEPMDDSAPSSLKTGVGNTSLASDEFYWQDYLGKDYAVTAFKLARQYGNADDKLFINDYNLEYNLAKCDGLIEYVKYIESQGVTVDGIGTQMHISITTDKDNIAQMFQKLGATGKLIKVTELDITIGTSTPTTDQLAEQAEMYQYVIDMYRTHVPVAQQYTVTIWGISDDPVEHENWLPDDAPNVWDAKYQRKHAYKGVADGLAGRDVSEDFTGELEY